MNFEDEPYARLYTRDTPSWKLLGWEAQTVLMHMLRDRFDRSGVFDCEGHDPSQAVTAVTGLPVEVVQRGLARLLESTTWVIREGKIVWPSLLKAQTCRRSDKARQRESRENRLAASLSPPVTLGHTKSQPVTPSLSLAEHNKPPVSPLRPSRRKPKTPIPADWSPTEAHQAKARTLGVDVVAEALKFRDHAEGKDTRWVDWDKAFSNWLAQAATYAPRGPNAKAPGLTEHERQQNERDAALVAEIERGDWGPKAQAIAAKRPVDLIRFRQAISAGRVKRVGCPPEALSGVGPTRDPSPVGNALSGALSGLGGGAS